MFGINSSIVLKVGVLVVSASLSACVTAPHHANITRTVEAPTPEPRDIFIYPSNGQSEAQTDRDRYECHQWAVQQSQFDPSLAHAGDVPQVTIITAPPGEGTAQGAVAGAIIGAAVSGRGNGPAGALVGAVTGAIIGTAADDARQERAEQAQRHYDRRYAQQLRPAQDYRRALSACMEGRGYTVK